MFPTYSLWYPMSMILQLHQDRDWSNKPRSAQKYMALAEISSRIRQPGLMPYSCPRLALWPWANCLTLLRPRFNDDNNDPSLTDYLRDIWNTVECSIVPGLHGILSKGEWWFCVVNMMCFGQPSNSSFFFEQQYYPNFKWEIEFLSWSW